MHTKRAGRHGLPHASSQHKQTKQTNKHAGATASPIAHPSVTPSAPHSRLVGHRDGSPTGLLVTSTTVPAGGAGMGASGAAQAPFGAASFTTGEVERIEALLKRKLDVGDVKQRKGQARARPQRGDHRMLPFSPLSRSRCCSHPPRSLRVLRLVVPFGRAGPR